MDGGMRKYEGRRKGGEEEKGMEGREERTV